jgi:hypothetical protein
VVPLPFVAEHLERCDDALQERQVGWLSGAKGACLPGVESGLSSTSDEETACT